MFRIQYQIENTAAATPNGGIMVRAPYFAYTGANTNAVLAQKPTGFNYDVCGARAGVLQPHHAGRVDDLQLGRRAGPVPAGLERLEPAVRVHGRLLRAPVDGRAVTTSTAPTATR